MTNFERHLERNHREEKSVRDMLKYPKSSKKRAEITTIIRKQGNFQEYLRGNTKPIYESTDSDRQYAPCAWCKGIYSQKFLYRHHKTCSAAKVSQSPGIIRHLAASQTLIACSLDTSNTINKLRVKREVFDRMKADDISLVAKTDMIIILHGEQYLKMHKRVQMGVVCSQKMRELARLLIELRKIENNEKLSMIDVLAPGMFDKVVAATKIVAGYDTEANTYTSPSLPPHLGTALKQVCELVLATLLRNPSSINCHTPEIKSKEVEDFHKLVQTLWNSEVSSLAFKDLNEKKWNKPIILPLTKDILRFKEYVISVANTAVSFLKNNLNDIKHYKDLVNATLSLTILFNRRRIGDVQFTLLTSYSKNFATSNQEELLNCLTPSEKVLTTHYKRVVTGGKGSKPTVILFPLKLQEYMDIILRVRYETNLVPSNNEYLFAHPNSMRWIRADTIIRRFAHESGIQRPSDISSNKLRKQIATVMQIVNMNGEEVNQFAQFMGHTEKTHSEFYQ